MAKITEIVSSLAVKVNVGDYQSTDFFTSMKVEIDVDASGTLAGIAAAWLNELTNAAMISNLKSHFAARGKKLSTADICKRYGLKPPTEKDFG